MLHVFNVNRGEMLTFDVNLAMDRFVMTLCLFKTVMYCISRRNVIFILACYFPECSS